MQGMISAEKRPRGTAVLGTRHSTDNPFARLWRALVGAFRDVESTRWGSVLLGNVWPAYMFALPLGARIWGLAHAQRGDTPHAQAAFLQEIVTDLFLGLVVVLFVIR